MVDKTHPYQERFTQTQRNYDRLSKWYDLLSGSSELKAQMIGLKMLGVKEGERVLELGFGTGRAMLDLAQSVGESGKVWGVDLSSGMTYRARSRLRQQGYAARTVFVIGNAVALPLHPDFFDAIFMSFTLELFNTEDIVNVLSECRRVLKNRGVMCVVALEKKNYPGIMSRMYEWVHYKFPGLVDCHPINAQMLITQAGLLIGKTSEIYMWGLPVQIILAEKQL